MDNLINVKDHLKPIIAKDIANEVYKKEIDEEAWDFTVKREYQSNKKKKTHRPFAAAHKSDALRSKDYVKTVRERFAEDVNSIAVAAGMSKIYDPRDYAAMGVNAPATKKLGQKQHALEVKGVATKVGIDNETVQTDFEMSMIERAHQDTSRHLDEVQFYWQSVSHKSPPQLDAAKLAVDTEMDKARMANDIRRDLDYLALEQERERSRANLVSQRQWKISKSASASAADVLRSAELEKAADAYIAKLDQQDKALTGNIAELEIFAAAFGAKQLERAIAEFGLKMDALGLERHGQPSADKSLPAKRSIIVKAGILERLKDYRPPAPELDETVLPSTAIENVVQQAGAPLLPPTPEAPPADVSVVAIADITATSIPVADMEPVEVARAITAKTVPPLPTYVDSDRKDNTPRTGDCANILPCVTLKQIDDGDLIGVQSPDATKDVSANLPAQVQPDVEALLEPAHDLPLPTSEPPASLIDLGFDPSGGTSAMQRPTIDDTTGDKLAADSVHQPVDKPQNAVTDRPEGNRMSVLVENSAAPSDLTDQQGFSPAQKPNGPTVIHDRIEQSVGLVDQMSGRRDAASGAVNSKTQHVKDETRTSSGVVNNPDAGNNVDRPIIASDSKNTDTKSLPAITQAPANQTHHMQLPTQISSAEDDLDPVTAYKVLWMYRDIDFKAQKSPMQPENRLHDKAMAHPQSNELLSALARRIGNKGDAAKVAIVPSAKLDKPLTQVPQSLPGTDNIVEQSSAEPESRVALARTVPSSVKSLDDPDKSVAAQPSIKDGAIKDNSKFDSAQARVAIPPPRADEHESLIHRFLTARDDKERRIAAGLIRADKTALERMAQHNDPRWIAFDRQFRIQQHTAGRDRGGIGW